MRHECFSGTLPSKCTNPACSIITRGAPRKTRLCKRLLNATFVGQEKSFIVEGFSPKILQTVTCPNASLLCITAVHLGQSVNEQQQKKGTGCTLLFAILPPPFSGKQRQGKASSSSLQNKEVQVSGLFCPAGASPRERRWKFRGRNVNTKQCNP